MMMGAIDEEKMLIFLTKTSLNNLIKEELFTHSREARAQSRNCIGKQELNIFISAECAHFGHSSQKKYGDDVPPKKKTINWTNTINKTVLRSRKIFYYAVGFLLFCCLVCSTRCWQKGMFMILCCAPDQFVCRYGLLMLNSFTCPIIPAHKCPNLYISAYRERKYAANSSTYSYMRNFWLVCTFFAYTHVCAPINLSRSRRTLCSPLMTTYINFHKLHIVRHNISNEGRC